MCTFYTKLEEGDAIESKGKQMCNTNKNRKSIPYHNIGLVVDICFVLLFYVRIQCAKVCFIIIKNSLITRIFCVNKTLISLYDA